MLTVEALEGTRIPSRGERDQGRLGTDCGFRLSRHVSNPGVGVAHATVWTGFERKGFGAGSANSGSLGGSGDSTTRKGRGLRRWGEWRPSGSRSGEPDGHGAPHGLARVAGRDPERGPGMLG